MLRAHRSHFCLRVIAEDRGFQSGVSDIQTETEQICRCPLSSGTTVAKTTGTYIKKAMSLSNEIMCIMYIINIIVS